MLPATTRLRRREEFTAVVRRGRRAGRPTLVVHRLAAATAGLDGAARPARVGFVVGRGVGNAVRRHEVTRRLRHLMRDRLDRLDRGDLLVVRAQPAASGRTSADLGADLDRALDRLGPIGAQAAAGAKAAAGAQPAHGARGAASAHGARDKGGPR